MVWPVAGRKTPKMSEVFMRRLEVLTQGWQPMVSPFRTSSSTSSETAPYLSFISPKTLTAPGSVSRQRSISEGSAKESRPSPS